MDSESLAAGIAAHEAAEAELRRGVTKTKVFATALLVLSGVVFVAARIFEEDAAPWVGYVRATAEAAMVGAIADWFAVTALFKRPLGLPIPHTAIIPERKDEFARSLADFMQFNFLTPEAIGERLQQIQPSRQIGNWLSKPENAQTIIGDISHVGTALSGMVGEHDAIGSAIHELARDRLHQIPAAPVLGRLIEEVTPQEGDEASSQSGVTAAATKEFAQRLRSDDGVIERVEVLKHELLDHPEFEAWTKELWEMVHQSVGEAVTKPDSDAHHRLKELIIGFGERLTQNEDLQHKFDQWIEQIVVYLAAVGTSQLGDLIAQTVDEWSAKEAADRIEPHVGRDLQFVRINGTLVGGLAGLIIFFISETFF